MSIEHVDFAHAMTRHTTEFVWSMTLDDARHTPKVITASMYREARAYIHTYDTYALLSAHPPRPILKEILTAVQQVHKVNMRPHLRVCANNLKPRPLPPSLKLFSFRSKRSTTAPAHGSSLTAVHLHRPSPKRSRPGAALQVCPVCPVHGLVPRRSNTRPAPPRSTLAQCVGASSS